MMSLEGSIDGQAGEKRMQGAFVKASRARRQDGLSIWHRLDTNWRKARQKRRPAASPTMTTAEATVATP